MRLRLANYRMAEFCWVLELSASAYYAWVRRPPTRRRQQDEELLDVIRQHLCA